MKVEPEQRAALLGEYIAKKQRNGAGRSAGVRVQQIHRAQGCFVPAAAGGPRLIPAGAGSAGPEQGRAASAGRGGHPPEIRRKNKSGGASL